MIDRNVVEKTVRRLSAEFFGPGYAGALDYLTERGLYLDTELAWHAPHGFNVTDKDRRALAFLAVEWGYDIAVITDAEVIPHRSRQH